MEPAVYLPYSRRMDLSARLDYSMKTAGYKSQSALARASGVSQSAVNRILKRLGKQGPDTATIIKLANACGVKSDWLISGIGPMLESAGSPAMALIYVDQAELQLLTYYREATIAGRRLIEDLAASVQKHITDGRK